MSEPKKDPEIEALEKQLEAAQKEAAAAAEKRERERRARALREEIARAKRQAEEEAALEVAEAEYGIIGKELRRVDTLDGMILVKRPERLLFKRFQDLDQRQVNAAEARKLVRPSVVYPPLERFDQMIEERSGILGECAIAVCELGGMKVKEIGGK